MATLVEAIECDLGPIDIAVLNAGIYLPTNFPEFDAAIFDRSFAVNLGGTVNCLAPLVPLMSARRAGRIAIVSSVAGYGGLPTSRPMVQPRPHCSIWASRWQWMWPNMASKSP